MSYAEAQNDVNEKLQLFLKRLDRVKKQSDTSFTALCPAHDDKKPSLSIKLEQDKILLHCHAGCTKENILSALNLEIKDLFSGNGRGGGSGRIRKPKSMMTNTAPGEGADVMPAEKPSLPAKPEKKPPEFLKTHADLMDSPEVMRMFLERYGLTAETVENMPWGLCGNVVLYYSDFRTDAFAIRSKFAKRPSPEYDAKKAFWDHANHKDTSEFTVYRGIEKDAFYLTSGEEKAALLWQITRSTVFLIRGGENGNLTKAQIEQIRASGARRVCVVFDADETGRKGAEKVCNSLETAGIPAAAPSWETTVDAARLAEVKGYDINDLMKDQGEEAVKAFLESARRGSAYLAHPWRTAEKSIDDWENFNPPEYLVESVIMRGGIHMIHGTAGSLKSMLALDLCGAVLTGERWLPGAGLDGFETKRARVIWLDCDNPPEILGERFKALYRRHKFDKGLFKTWSHLNPPADLMTPEHLRDLENLIFYSGAEMAVIDCMRNIYSGDENTTDAGRVLASLRGIAARTGAAFLIIHHDGKNGKNEKGMSSPRGSSSIAAACDGAYSVTRETENGEFTDCIQIAPSKTRRTSCGAIRAEFRYNTIPGTRDQLEEFCFVRIPPKEQPEEATGTRSDERVLQYLIDHPGGANQRTISETLDMHERTTSRALRRLEARKQTECRRGGRSEGILWTLAPVKPKRTEEQEGDLWN